MTITLYTGSPGSGKSYNCVRTIYSWLTKRKNNSVIANFDITINNEKLKKRIKGKFTRIYDEDINIDYMINYYKENHLPNVEAQTLLIIDEASLFFNSREWMVDKGRKDWLKFMAQHRKFGYEIILICQNDRQIDRQIRSLVEYEKIHRKANNHKILSLFPKTLFVCVNYWYVLNMRVDSEMFFYRKKYGEIYDTFNTFNYKADVISNKSD